MRIWSDIALSRAPGAAFVAMGMVWAAFAAQVPVLKAQIGASDAVFGGLFLIASLGAIASMWIAPLVDRALGALSVAVSSALLGLSFAAVGFAPGVVIFAALLFAVSAVSGVCDILMNARISEIEAQARRPLMSLNHAIFSFAYAGTAVLTGIAREAGWGPIAVFAAIAVVILVLSLGMRAPHLSQPEVEGGAGPVPRGIVWIGGLIVLAAFFAEQATEGWSALHIERGLGGGAAEGAFGPAILGLTMGFGRLFGHLLSARIPDTVMIAAACLLSAAGTALAALAPTIAIAYLGFAVLGLGVSVVVPLAMAIIGRMVPQSQRVRAIGQASAIGYGAFLFGPPIMGSVSETISLPAAFGVVAISLVSVALILVPLLTRRIALAD
ncbi:MFS transporter [Thalassococcus sp. S3]|uniref:MFS transporter n=1 Tax=Thalassococcus sp. S3 TaxID=2017482 RepID=UPI00102442C8|nr:MFS transporter [Thalassococcus sp. S3]QBF30756.1 MFS transporter [Thalassococcus sp. S3]